MLVNLFSVKPCPDNGNEIRKSCQEYSEHNPDDLILGGNVLGFPMLQTANRITADHVRFTDLGGYWKAGTFQLFTPGELALLDREDDDEITEADCTCKLQKGTPNEGLHHPECDCFDGHN